MVVPIPAQIAVPRAPASAASVFLLHNPLEVVLVLGALLGPRPLPHRPEGAIYLPLDSFLDPPRGEEQVTDAEPLHDASPSRGRHARPRASKRTSSPGRRPARRFF